MSTVSLRLFMAFIIALVLTILPLPELLAGIRPPWVLLLVLYLQFYMPDYFRVTVLFIAGLFLDVLLSTVIGEHTLALSLVALFASNKSRRFYCFTLGQQMLVTGFFCFLYQLTIVTIDGFLGFHASLIAAVCSAIMSALLWPWIRLIAEEVLLSKMPQRR